MLKEIKKTVNLGAVSSKQDFTEKEVGLLSSRTTFGKNSAPRRQSVTLNDYT
jgi:hypothetical protein